SMTTVTDPNGNPTVVFNRGGTAIVELIPAGSGNDNSDAAAIPRVCGHTIAMAAAPTAGEGLVLPADAEVGDKVDVLGLGPEVLTIWADDGTVLNLDSLNISASRTASFVKVASNRWLARA